MLHIKACRLKRIYLGSKKLIVEKITNIISMFLENKVNGNKLFDFPFLLFVINNILTNLKIIFFSKLIR